MLLISRMDKGRFLKDVGQRLRALRGGKTQESVCDELSRLLGAKRTKEAYQHYEAGRRLVPADVLWGLSVVYGVSADWILSGKRALRGRKPNIVVPSLNKDMLSLAGHIQALTKEQKNAVQSIVAVLGRKRN